MKPHNLFNLPFASTPSQVEWLSPNDHQWLIHEVENAARRHLQLDWQILPEMLRSPEFRCRVIREGRQIRSLIGVNVQLSAWHTERVGWLRLLLPGTSRQPDPSLDLVWATIKADLKAEGIQRIGLLALDPWIETLAAALGFERTNAVITLRRQAGPIPPPPGPTIRIREISQTDLDDVAALDAMAFELFWHHSRAGLETAWKQAATFTVLENDEGLLGYQLSTWHIDSGHLARLAVRPDRQGQGLGAMLVGEMLRFFAERDVSQITVNTQADNFASQQLYQRLGFKGINHSIGFWTVDLA